MSEWGQSREDLDSPHYGSFHWGDLFYEGGQVGVVEKVYLPFLGSAFLSPALREFRAKRGMMRASRLTTFAAAARAADRYALPGFFNKPRVPAVPGKKNAH